jgi:hypothetical protein
MVDYNQLLPNNGKKGTLKKQASDILNVQVSDCAFIARDEENIGVKFFTNNRVVSDEDFPPGCIAVETGSGQSLYFNRKDDLMSKLVKGTNFTWKYDCE